MLISILIPTRERADYLAAAIESCLHVREDVEVIVSDNASEDHTESVVRSLGDSRLRYLNTGRRVSMRQNFDFGMAAAQGDYVICMGDDDAILPGQFPALVRILKAHQPTVLSWVRLSYSWPIHGFGRRAGECRFERSKLFGTVTRIDTLPLREHLLHARYDWMRHQPAIYHGCVARRRLEAIKARTGAYFNGKIPDIYVAYDTILDTREFHYVNHPFSINGNSPASTGNAHHAYDSSDPRSDPARRFVAEVERDPVQDVVPGHVPTLAMSFFSTLETVCRDLGRPEPMIDRLAWYRHILAATDRNDARLWTATREALRSHAERTRTVDLLEQAEAAPRRRYRRPRKSVLEVLRYGISKARSVRISMQDAGRNTASTAARVVDHVIGDGYTGSDDDIHRLWPSAKRRAVARSKSSAALPPAQGARGRGPS